MEITNEELLEKFNYWWEHYNTWGDKHYSDTPDWKITELYYDMIVNRILQELPEMVDGENEDIIERLNNLV